MSAFDWPSFLQSRSIRYVTEGPSVRPGNIAIRCIFCGAGDQSEHLTISLSGKGWYCYRNPTQHKGTAPKLVKELINCTWEQALEITGAKSSYVPDNFLSRIEQMLEPKAKLQQTHTLKLPSEFKSITEDLPSANPYVNYLLSRKRGFLPDEILKMKRFNIRYCTRGLYQGRIIFPVIFEKKLVTWTGRSISASPTLRYQTLPADPERAKDTGYPSAIGPVTNYLLWYDLLCKTDCDTIILCEGPFDGLKVNILGNPHGICSTCFFTISPSESQVNLLHSLLPRFKRRILLLDQETTAVTLHIKQMLHSLKIETKRLPAVFKDPGELKTSSQLLSVLRT